MQTAKWEGARLAAQGPGAAGPGQQGVLVLHVPILSTLSQSCPAFASQQRLKLCS